MTAHGIMSFDVDNVRVDNRAPAISLPDVTLVAISSVALTATVRALRESLQQIEFGAVLLLSDICPWMGNDHQIEWRQIERLDSRRAYSKFMLQELAWNIETSHALCIQWDGYVINAGGWHDQFLDYDYIGAPWPHFRDGHNVGNGGFSLRSTALLKACASLPVTGDIVEDIVICRTYRPLLEKKFGLRFAPDSEARKFAYERIEPTGNEFGFHGAFNMVKILDHDDLAKLFDAIEWNVLNDQEHREILIWACRNGRVNLAWQIIRRMWSRKAINR